MQRKEQIDEVPVRGADVPIEVHVSSTAQLFQTIDPSPFRDTDLAREAEDYIVYRARYLPWKSRIRIEIFLPPDALEQKSASDAGPALRSHFALKARKESNEIHELFAFGRRALAIGAAILAVCQLIAWQMGNLSHDRTAYRVIEDTFVIVGWVAIWRPADVFLYEWLPIARRRSIFRRLSEATVTLHQSPNGSARG